MRIFVLIGTVVASPQTGEVLPLCDFLSVQSCPFFSATCPGRTTEPIYLRFVAQTTFFRVRSCLLRVRMMVTSVGGICPQNYKNGFE